ncbi:hypothetical protein DERF_002422 [Dermatophagoides farinae]|uniref:Uncharacterized protein n=1 Tax=Dermatophagoides farinae TaxID=6954 RepID=A0A922L9M5_DERFA|nr:hypothetical protein DERF_002422 [Dermatophagoides farinae]
MLSILMTHQTIFATIAFIADIKAAFHNIHIQPDHQKYVNKIETSEFHTASSKIFEDASMELRKWQCSDPEIDKLWCDGLGENKVLGVIWNKSDDTIQVVIPLINFSKDVTKRSLLTTLASIYDPMGLLLPSTIQLKFFISELWTRKIDWDDPLSPALHGRASRILNDIHNLGSGAWEAMIKTTKKALYSTVWGKDLTIDNFRTILYELSSIINSRPIAELNGHILTPNKLMFGSELRTSKIMKPNYYKR